MLKKLVLFLSFFMVLPVYAGSLPEGARSSEWLEKEFGNVFWVDIEESWGPPLKSVDNGETWTGYWNDAFIYLSKHAWSIGDPNQNHMKWTMTFRKSDGLLVDYNWRY